jgi:hypothetical protein
MDKGTTTQAIKLARHIKVKAVETETIQGYCKYGENNLFPQYLLELYSTSAMHGALCNNIAMMIAGKGLTSDIAAVDNEIKRLELNNYINAIALDVKIHGAFYMEVIYSLDRTRIAKVNYLPAETIRLAVANEDEDVVGVYYSRDWADIRKKKNKPEYIPIYNPEHADEQARQVYIVGQLTAGSMYYSRPDYYASIDWIEITRKVTEYHLNNLANGLFPSFHIAYKGGIPSPEDQRKTIDDIESNISGTMNAGKFFITWSESSDTAPEITSFPITDADKQYSYISDEARLQILLAHRLTSPLIVGIREQGGGLGSNTDELASALYVFTKQVIEPAQKLITDAVEDILSYNNVAGGVVITPNDILPPKTVAAPAPSMAPALPTAQVKQAAVCAEQCDEDLTDEQGDLWLEHLETVGEKIDLNEYELVNEQIVDDVNDENKLVQVLQYKKYSSGLDKRSVMDAGLYKVRYAYTTGLRPNSRTFCKKMVDLALKGIVYRWEDLSLQSPENNMSSNGVNSRFARAGQAVYDIFLFKGGKHCYHAFKRQIYKRKLASGPGQKGFLPDEPENYREISTIDALSAGVPLKDINAGYATASTPTRFLE